MILMITTMHLAIDLDLDLAIVDIYARMHMHAHAICACMYMPFVHESILRITYYIYNSNIN